MCYLYIIAPKIKIIWFSILWILSVPYEGFSRNAIVRTKFDIYVFIIVDEHELAVGRRLVAMHHMGVAIHFDISRVITSTDWLVWEYWYQNEQYSIESVCDN